MPQQSMEPKIQKLAVVASYSGPNLRQHIDSKLAFYRGKRFFDVTVSLCVSVFILSWLFPLIALMIVLESRGPVLFIQRRVGMGGRTLDRKSVV